MRPKLAAVLLLSVAAIAGCKRDNTYAPPPPPKVVVAHPVQSMVTPYLDTTGNTAAFNQVDLVARVSGFLQQIRYTDGQFVHRGDTLFVIEPGPYRAKLMQAQAAVQSAQAQVAQSDAEYQRQASLGRSAFAAASSVQQAQAQREMNRANLLSQQEALAMAATNLSYTQVTAPFDGIVTAHDVSVGSMVGATTPTRLATIVQTDPIYVKFSINEQEVLTLTAIMRQHGMGETELRKVPVEIGLMNEQGYPHQGTLDYAAPSVDPTSGTLTLRGALPNHDHMLLPGLFVRVRVPLLPAEALLVPDTALGTDQTGRYLLVVDKDKVVHQSTVTTGQEVGTLRVIVSGVKPDDEVIVSGLERAIPGDKVDPSQGQIDAAHGVAGKS